MTGIARCIRLIRSGMIEEPGRRLGSPPRILRFSFRFIDHSPERRDDFVLRDVLHPSNPPPFRLPTPIAHFSALHPGNPTPFRLPTPIAHFSALHPSNPTLFRLPTPIAHFSVLRPIISSCTLPSHASLPHQINTPIPCIVKIFRIRFSLRIAYV